MISGGVQDVGIGKVAIVALAIAFGFASQDAERLADSFIKAGDPCPSYEQIKRAILDWS